MYNLIVFHCFKILVEVIVHLNLFYLPVVKLVFRFIPNIHRGGCAYSAIILASYCKNPKFYTFESLPSFKHVIVEENGKYFDCETTYYGSFYEVDMTELFNKSTFNECFDTRYIPLMYKLYAKTNNQSNSLENCRRGFFYNIFRRIIGIRKKRSTILLIGR